MPVAAVQRDCHHYCTAPEREFPFPDHPGVLQTRNWPRQEAVRCEHQAAIATANSSDMNAACLRMSLFGNQRICPLRIMFTVSIP